VQDIQNELMRASEQISKYSEKIVSEPEVDHQKLPMLERQLSEMDIQLKKVYLEVKEEANCNKELVSKI